MPHFSANLTMLWNELPVLDRFRAARRRFGLDGKMIDFGKSKELPARELLTEMLEWFVDDVVDELGSRREVEYAFQIMRGGTSADRQLAVYDQTGDLRSVVDRVVSETAEGVRPELASLFAARVATGQPHLAVGGDQDSE